MVTEAISPADSAALDAELSSVEVRLKALRLRCPLCKMHRGNVLAAIRRTQSALAAWRAATAGNDEDGEE